MSGVGIQTGGEIDGKDGYGKPIDSINYGGDWVAHGTMQPCAEDRIYKEFATR